MTQSYWQSSFPQAIQLASLNNDAQADLCVVGLGGTGLSALHAALEQGYSVIGIDAHEIASGAAGSNGGFLLAGLADFLPEAIDKHGYDFACQWYENTLKTIEWMNLTSPHAIKLTGSLRVSASTKEDEDCERHYEALKEARFSGQWYQGHVNIHQHKALLIPNDGVFNPYARCQHMAKLCMESGAKLYSHSPAISIESGTIHTPQAVIKAERILVCVDGRLNQLFPKLSADISTWRLQMLATEPIAKITDKAIYQRYGYDYWQQLSNGQVLLGGGRDIGGTEEQTSDTQTTETVQNYLDSLVAKQFGSQTKVTQRWAASVSYNHLGLPIQQEVLPGVWALGAYNGTGNVIGPMLARQILSNL